MAKQTRIDQAFIEFANLLGAFQKSAQEVFVGLAPQETVVEQIRPFYVNPLYEQLQLPLMYRYQEGKKRYYFTAQAVEGPEPTGNAGGGYFIVRFYPSVTTIIDNATPMSYGLKKLLGELGADGFYKMMREKARYGTLMHEIIADYLRSGNAKETRSINLDELPARIQLFTEQRNIDFDTSDWLEKLQNDILSLIQFIRDYEVEPIAIEIVGKYDDGNYRFAGAIDMICEMTIEEKGYFGEVYKSGEKKGEPKETKQKRRVTALVDFKSGRSGFFQDHVIQLKMYQLMAEQSLGLKIEKVFNCAPREWIGSVPTYDLKDQTDSNQGDKIPHLLGAFMVDYKEPKEIRVIKGIVNGEGDLSENCFMTPAADYVLKHINAKHIPVKTQAEPAKTAMVKQSEPAGILNIKDSINDFFKTN